MYGGGGGGVCGQNICYHVVAFDMQHEIVLKKLNFDLWGLGVSARKDICYYVAEFVIPFYLICNMTMF